MTARWWWLLTPAARTRRWLLARLGIATRGAKVIVTNASGEILLVRNSYGGMRCWSLPGGGIKRRETPHEGARREVREETTCIVTDLTPFAVYASTDEGRRDTVHLFTARSEDAPTPDGFEVSEASFFPLEGLPPNIGKATQRRIDEWRGRRALQRRW